MANDAVSMPIFQPLIGFDKIDIMNLAQSIGTYETSIYPMKTAVPFSRQSIHAHPRLDRIIKSEALVNGEN